MSGRAGRSFAANATVDSLSSRYYGRCFKVACEDSVHTLSDFLLVGLKFPDEVLCFSAQSAWKF